MSNLHIVTGYRGQAHVSASDSGALNAAIFGSGEYVLGKGNKLAASVISNNQIRIADGDIMMQGRHIRLNEGSYVDLMIENGSQETSRNDLIVARYTKDSVTGVEDCNLVVIKGTEAASNPVDPAYTTGDIIEDHDLQNDMLLYRVPLIGLNVQALECLFTTVTDSFRDMSDKQGNTNSLTAENTLADADTFPFYDSSATANRKTTWSNIKNKLASVFAAKTHASTHATGGSDPITPANIGALSSANNAVKAANIQSGAVSTTYTATVATGWSGSGPYTKAVTISGLLEADTPIVDLVASTTYATAQSQIEAWGYVYKGVTAANTLTLYATEKPTVSLPIQVKVVRK